MKTAFTVTRKDIWLHAMGLYDTMEYIKPQAYFHIEDHKIYFNIERWYKANITIFNIYYG